MAKTLKDILNGVKASKVVPGSTGKDPGVDYEPKAPNEQEFVKLHKTEKHSDRVGNGDDVYQATNIKPALAKETKHGRKNIKDSESVNEAAKCNMTAEGVSCPVHEMADCSKPKKTLKEVLTKNTSAGDIIHDFRKSKDPKFAGKSDEKRKQMALGAYYSMHPEKSKKTNEEVEPINEVNHREYGAKGKMHPDMAKGMDVGMHTDFYQHGTGDKGYGMVTKNDGKTVHVRSKARTGTLGKTHKFTVTPHLGEEIEHINEVNHREYGAKGKMHPDMAKDLSVGMHADFYQHGTGDKGYGMVTKNDGKTVHVRSKARTGTLGKTHKFTVTPHLGEETEGFNSGALHGVGSTEIVEATDLHPDYKLVKTGKKSTTAHPDGKPTYDLHYKGEKLTSIHPYSAYKDKKTPGSRVVASRKDITKYSASLPGRKTSELNDTTAAHVANSVIRHHQASIKEDLAVPLLGGSDGDESAEMAKTQLRALANKALHLAMQLGDEQIIEPWVQAKIAVAKDHVSAVHDYMVYGDHSKDKEEDEQTAPYDGGIDMTGAPRNTYPDFSVDVNTGRNV